jgi:hypothetical protein
VPDLIGNDEARMTNAELMTNDKSRISKGCDNGAASLKLDDVPALNIERPTLNSYRGMFEVGR